jgi:hypothetical protein
LIRMPIRKTTKSPSIFAVTRLSTIEAMDVPGRRSDTLLS